eukprot:TRINITY_DN4148_c0_g1_i2.p1 TRINITY_DN4148_c0_g1~~TRINITY_DN4148_c0_g1_i2.p1  ORF type:complete len:155 (-),score=21.19 TRINITY_DN4148_c0_g1_i2:279-692(-)
MKIHEVETKSRNGEQVSLPEIRKTCLDYKLPIGVFLKKTIEERRRNPTQQTRQTTVDITNYDIGQLFSDYETESLFHWTIVWRDDELVEPIWEDGRKIIVIKIKPINGPLLPYIKYETPSISNRLIIKEGISRLQTT